MTKLEQLAEAEGFDDPFDMIEENVIESVVPGICEECDYTTQVEPDCENGWCEVCERPSVVSCLVLGGVI